MYLVSVLRFIAGESSNVKDADIITTGMKLDGMEMIQICEAPQRGNPVQLASNPVKSTKLRISTINIMRCFFFFFIKVGQILGI